MSTPVEIQNTCFLALQRPAMFWGVPQMGCMLNVTGCIILSNIISLASAHAWYALAWPVVMAPTVHFIMREGIRRDYFFFNVLKLGWETKNNGSHLWGGDTLSPLCGWPGRRSRKKGWDQL